MRALLVGDAETEVAREALAARGHELVAVAGPADVLDALARGPTPDVVVVTAQQAAACQSAIRAVRSHLRGAAAALVALVPEAAVEAALDAGADQVLPAPAPRAHIAAALARAERAAARARVAPPASAMHDLCFAGNPHPMWFYDVDTLGFVAVNQAAVLKYGWSRDEFLEMTIKDIRPPEDVERLLQVTSQVASGLDHSRGWRHRAKDGRVFHVEIISSPVRFAGRSCELILAHDVSDRVAAERQLEELRAQVVLSDRMASIGTLAAGVAHEINNPLTFVLANLEFLGERLPALPGDQGPALREALADALDGARRVQEIVGDLKAFSRADDASIGPVDLARTVASALAMAANELRHRARTEVEVASAPSPLANEARLGQVLLNLVVNAAHAIPEGNADGNLVRISARREGDRVAIEVSDTGPGVPAEIRARIFDPFFTTKPAGVGTGLGLWVCRRIATELGGAIELLPGAGRGATFRVTLPAAAGAPATAAASSRLPPAAPTQRARVLIVDDEPLVGRALRRALGGLAEVQVEESGRAAVARLARGERFDLVLSDVMMPELPGADFHAAVERIDPALARSVVFMTGGAFSSREQEFLARVSNVCLQKPLDLARLRALLGTTG